MRTSFMRFMLCAVVAITFTACDKEIYNENGMLPDGTTADGAVPEGYFRATFFPEQGGDASTRLPLDNKLSKAIQSLICIIYKEESDGTTFSYVTEKSVFDYKGKEATENGISDDDAKDYLWPYQTKVEFVLPIGYNYRAVFVGNSAKELFYKQDNPILSQYQTKYSDARLSMPDEGPTAFNNYNMLHLCTVDFSEEDFAEGATPPHVLMQRVVSSNIYGRKTIDVTNDLRDVVNNLVDDIMKNDKLLTSSVSTLLSSNLTSWLKNKIPLIKLAIDVALIALGGSEYLVSLLTTGLVGPLLDGLRQALLDELTNQLQSAIQGDTDVSLLGLGYILAPWEHVDYVEITYASLPQNIDFDRRCTLESKDAGPYKYELKDFSRPKPEVSDETEEFRTFTVTTFCGEQEVSMITVNSNGILGGLFDAVDGQLLDGLLVNIQNTTPPLIYPAESNRQYTTFYDLLNVKLNDVKVKVSTPDDPLSSEDLEGMKPVKIDLNVVLGVLSLENTLGSLLGPLGESLGKTVDDVLGFVEDVVRELIGGDNGIKIYLPSLLDINNISVTGQWSETEVSFSETTIPHNP